MGIIKFIYLWGKSIVLWLLVKRNREIGFRYTKKALDVFEFASKLTATKKDDKAVAYIAEQFDKAVKLNKQTDETVIEKAAKSITKVSKGNMKDVSIGLAKGKVKAAVGNIGVEYNPLNGQVKFGLSQSI